MRGCRKLQWGRTVGTGRLGMTRHGSRSLAMMHVARPGSWTRIAQSLFRPAIRFRICRVGNSFDTIQPAELGNCESCLCLGLKRKCCIFQALYWLQNQAELSMNRFVASPRWDSGARHKICHEKMLKRSEFCGSTIGVAVDVPVEQPLVICKRRICCATVESVVVAQVVPVWVQRVAV